MIACMMRLLNINALRKAENAVILNETENTIHGFEMVSKISIVIRSIKNKNPFFYKIYFAILMCSKTMQ